MTDLAFGSADRSTDSNRSFTGVQVTNFAHHARSPGGKSFGCNEAAGAIHTVLPESAFASVIRVQTKLKK